MAASNVPTFGNWESDDSVPYTVYFDKARKNKGRANQPKIINPNHVQGINPYANRDTDLALPPPPAADPPRRLGAKPEEFNSGGSIRSTPEHNLHPSQREDDHIGHYVSNRRPAQFTNPPAVRNVNAIRTTTSESSYGSNRHVQRPGRAPYDQSIDGSVPFNNPRDDHQAARERRNPQSSSPWDEAQQYGSARSTPSRAPARHRPTPQRNEPPEEKGASVPIFGDWNENDPKSAENFTGVFEIVRAERNAAPEAGPSITPKQAPHQPQAHHPSSKKQRIGCFSWLKKKISG